jgi:hypothetical protein
VDWAKGLIDSYLGGDRRRVRWPEDEQEAAHRVEESLDRLSGLDALGGAAPTVEVFRRALDSELEATLRRIGRAGDGGSGGSRVGGTGSGVRPTGDAWYGGRPFPAASSRGFAPARCRTPGRWWVSALADTTRSRRSAPSSRRNRRCRARRPVSAARRSTAIDRAACLALVARRCRADASDLTLCISLGDRRVAVVQPPADPKDWDRQEFTS